MVVGEFLGALVGLPVLGATGGVGATAGGVGGTPLSFFPFPRDLPATNNLRPPTLLPSQMLIITDAKRKRKCCFRPRVFILICVLCAVCNIINHVAVYLFLLSQQLQIFIGTFIPLR
mmetsp:Transcript_11210/g.12435  ORF Transcript_11210/g.12435 Transcript_11210/m.12435 type:complete len:117 (-) Transcript_11210:120-470(-)